MTDTFGRFAATPIGPLLAARDGGLTLATTGATALASHARSDFGLDAGTVATFLDTRHGRHFADDVVNEFAAGKAIAEAIEAATVRWMAWRISPRTAHETDILRGLPYKKQQIASNLCNRDFALSLSTHPKA